MFNLSHISKNKETGFTLIELLVVILIIGVLAAIAVPMFLNQRNAANEASQKSDIKRIATAVNLLHTKKSTTLFSTVGERYSFNECLNLTLTGRDPINVPRTDTCWVAYFATLKKISDASGLDVTNLVDPYGRPYYINPNEGETSANDCRTNLIGYWDSSYSYNNITTLPLSSNACI